MKTEEKLILGLILILFAMLGVGCAASPFGLDGYPTKQSKCYEDGRYSRYQNF